MAFAAKLAKVAKIAKMAKVAKIAKEAKAAKETKAGGGGRKNRPCLATRAAIAFLAGKLFVGCYLLFLIFEKIFTDVLLFCLCDVCLIYTVCVWCAWVHFANV